MPDIIKPKLLALEVTRRCRYSCRHCRAAIKGSDPVSAELTTDQWKRIFTSIADFNKCVVIFTGGEPTERPDLLDLITHARNLGLRTVMATCGYNIDDQFAAQLKKAGILAISLSLDGATPDSHDNFRRTPGAFQTTLKAAQTFKKANIRFQINTTISKTNIEEIPQIADLARDIGAYCFNPFILVPTGAGSQIADQILDPTQYEDLLHQLLHIKQNSPIEVRVTCGPQFARLCRQQNVHTIFNNINGCMGGNEFGFISAHGDIQTCGFLNISAGNLTENNFNFADIWQNSPFLKRLRNLSAYKGKCSRCEFLQPCRGCRARAYTLTGSYLASDPICSYKPGKTQ